MCVYSRLRLIELSWDRQTVAQIICWLYLLSEVIYIILQIRTTACTNGGLY